MELSTLVTGVGGVLWFDLEWCGVYECCSLNTVELRYIGLSISDNRYNGCFRCPYYKIIEISSYISDFGYIG